MRLQAMTDTIEHRGPDDDGLRACARRSRLGFRRLSIIDVAGGPPADRDAVRTGSSSIVGNGEVYNFRELREGLEPPAARDFATGSDIETILHALSPRPSPPTRRTRPPEDVLARCRAKLVGMYGVRRSPTWRDPD